MKIYKSNILRLCETRWKENSNLITDDGHLFFYRGDTKYHRNGVGFMIQKNIKETVMEFTLFQVEFALLEYKINL